MKVAASPGELEPKQRAVAIGTFDGVHLGHRRVLDAVEAAGLVSTVVTFDPHPRVALGYEVELLATLERRLELLEQAGIEETLVVEFDLELARLEPEEFVEAVLRPIGAEVVVAGVNFRFGRSRSGDLGLLGGARLRRACRSACRGSLVQPGPRAAACRRGRAGRASARPAGGGGRHGGRG